MFIEGAEGVGRVRNIKIKTFTKEAVMCKTYRGLWIIFLSALVILSVGWSKEAQCQTKYPNHAIDIVVPFNAGGGTDAAARLPASYLSKKWGVPVNVINKPGGNTLPAVLDIYAAKPDGYTIFMDSSPSSSMLDVVITDLPIKVMDRTFIAMTSSYQQIFIVPSTSPYKTLNDLVADVKRNPADFTWSSGGGASGQDFMFRQFFKAVGVDIAKTKPVMYSGGSQITAAVGGGHIKVGSTNVITARPSVQAGLVKILAITRERHPDFANVPTMAELGYPSVNFTAWFFLSGPPKMPSSIVKVWDTTIKEMLSDKDFRAQFKNIGFNSNYMNADETKEVVKKESEEVAVLWGVKK